MTLASTKASVGPLTQSQGCQRDYPTHLTLIQLQYPASSPGMQPIEIIASTSIQLLTMRGTIRLLEMTYLFSQTLMITGPLLSIDPEMEIMEP